MSGLRDRLHWVRCKLHLHRWGFKRDYQGKLYRECRDCGSAACCTVRMGLAVPIRSLVAETEAPEATGTKPVVVQRCRSVLGRTASGSGSPMAGTSGHDG
jgi:hypothetical protein